MNRWLWAIFIVVAFPSIIYGGYVSVSLIPPFNPSTDTNKVPAVQSNGTVAWTAVSTAASGSFLPLAGGTMTGVITASTGGITFTGTNGNNKIVIPGSETSALLVQRASDSFNYMQFDTTGNVTLGGTWEYKNSIQMDDQITFTGSGKGINFSGTDGLIVGHNSGTGRGLAVVSSSSGNSPYTDYIVCDTNASAATAGCGFAGVLNGSAATSGFVGEYFSSAVTAASGGTGATTVTKNITSIVLQPGDWDITGQCSIDTNITGTEFACGISSTSATFPAAGLKGDSWLEAPTTSSAAADYSLTIADVRALISTSTTYYLVVKSTFSSGTPTYYGRIRARRAR